MKTDYIVILYKPNGELKEYLRASAPTVYARTISFENLETGEEVTTNLPFCIIKREYEE